jgi:integrase
MKKQRRRGKGEGSIYQRKGDKRWVGSFRTEDGSRKYVYGETYAITLEKLRKAQREHQQGMVVTGPQTTITLRNYLEDWLETVRKPALRVSTYVRYRGNLDNHILPKLGHIPLRKLTTEHIEAFYAMKLKEGLSPRSIRGMHGLLHSALDHAVQRKRIPINICEHISLPRVTKHEIHPLTGDEARRLLETAKGHRLEALLTVAIATGMRRGELLALRWRDIDFHDGSLQIRRTVNRIAGFRFVENEPKTVKGRRKVSLPHFVLEALKKHRLLQEEARRKAGTSWQERDIVFCNRNGDFLFPDHVDDLFHKLLEDADLPRVRFHDLRHSAATILLSLGVHPKVVQELLGHSQISVTMDTYSHVLPSLQKDVMDGLDDFFGGENDFL